MKKFLCWVFGHIPYICESCQKNLDLLFKEGGQPREWSCQEADRCQNVCRRCGSQELG